MAFWYCSVIVSDGVKNWKENPVLMTVENFDSPLQSIDFPAITLCLSPDFQPDNWALTEQVFNSFEFNCESKRGNKTRKCPLIPMKK